MKSNEIIIFLESRVCKALGIEYNQPGAESSHGKDEIIKAIEDKSRFPHEMKRDANVLRSVSGENVLITNRASGYFKVLKG